MFKYLLFFVGLCLSQWGYSQTQQIFINPVLVKEKQLAVNKAEQSRDKVKIKEAKINLLEYQISYIEIGSTEYKEKEKELKELKVSQQKTINQTNNSIGGINNAPKEQRRKIIDE